eukprot:scaffold267527_cov24-Tisochrysis_lutea.AAC.1
MGAAGLVEASATAGTGFGTGGGGGGGGCAPPLRGGGGGGAAAALPMGGGAGAGGTSGGGASAPPGAVSAVPLPTPRSSSSCRRAAAIASAHSLATSAPPLITLRWRRFSGKTFDERSPEEKTTINSPDSGFPAASASLKSSSRNVDTLWSCAYVRLRVSSTKKRLCHAPLLDFLWSHPALSSLPKPEGGGGLSIGW